MRLPHEVVVVAVAAGQPVGGQREGDEAGADEQRGEAIEPVERGRRGDGSRRRPLLRSQAPHRSLETDLDLTGPAIGEPDPGRAAPRRTGSGDTGGILVLLALGLTFRLIIAYLLPGSGFKNDIGAFQFWANELADHGLYGFYGRGFFIDYSPGYLYVLWLVGVVGNIARWRRRPDQDPADPRRPGPGLPRLVDEQELGGQRADGPRSVPPSSCSTRSRGSTASSGVRSTRWASSSCCSRCASCGATGPSGRRSSRRSPR